MNSSLTSPVLFKEVEQAVFELGTHKAPGPDGLNGLFFQRNWSIIKEDIFKAVHHFFTEGILDESINFTSVALIPKVPHPEPISQLRPTSCCSFIYKIIAKIFVKRLKPILSDAISLQQSAFVGGRQIQDNLIIAHEAFHFLKKKQGHGGRGIAVKLDMNKAYDRVSWEFLELALQAYGFSMNWIKLVMTLVSTVSYSYQVNGFNSDKVNPPRGLRQGDPLSPTSSS